MRILTRALDITRLPLLREYVRGRRQRNAVFLWIPKTGGTTLYSCLPAPKLKTTSSIRRRFPQRGIVTFGHMDYRALLGEGYVSQHFDKSAFKFSFVRNPYERAVSLFFYLKRAGALGSEESFLSFCRHLVECGCEPIGLYNVRGLSQCNPQVRWIERLDMDFIGRVENLADDCQVIFSELGLGMPELPWLNVTNHEYNLWDAYCSESLDMVESYYAEDFEQFNYPRDRLVRKRGTREES